MGKIENFVSMAKAWANDPAHGYDQNNRWGPNVDCSSLPILLLEQCGIKVRTAGATYTGNMKSVFLRCGFELADVSALDLTIGAKLQAGDILLNEADHAAIYVGNNQIVHASINEKGGTTGGQSGDQTGKEVCIRSYYNYPWDCVLRYKEKSTGAAVKSTATAVKPTGNTYTVKPGDSWWEIAQNELGNGALMTQLAKLNGKTTASVIHPGDVITLRDDHCSECEVGTNENEKARLETEVEKLGGRIVW